MNLPCLDQVLSDAAFHLGDLTPRQSSSSTKMPTTVTGLYNRASAKARTADSEEACL
jgi:hypothetical protein